MQKEFRQWLVNVKHLNEYSPTGSRSTAIDYPWRISRICQVENIGWEQLAADIDIIAPKYNKSGVMGDIGKSSHESFINAIRYFKEFAGEWRKNHTTQKTSQKRWKLW